MIGNQNIAKENRQAEEECLIFDTHTHYDDAQFDGDRTELFENIAQRGYYIVNVGASLASTRQSIALAKKYAFVHAAAGIHPTNTGELTEQSFGELVALLDEEKVVAVGEIGLDYFWEKEPGRECPREVQKYWFGRQLALAVEKNVPVIIHSRDAAEDTLLLIQQECGKARANGRQLTGVIHCFSYGKEMAKEYVNLGFYLGIGGVLTFKNARRIREVVMEIPLNYLVLETDCPYLAPEPYRGQRNCSLNLPLVVNEIARIKEISKEEVICATTKNAKQLYRLL